VRLAIHREKNVALERAASANAWVRAWNVRYVLSTGFALTAVLLAGGIFVAKNGAAPASIALTREPAQQTPATGPTNVPRSTLKVPGNNRMMSTVSTNHTSDVGPAPIGAIDESKTDARIDSLINSDVMKLSDEERAQYYQRRIEWLQSRKSQQPSLQH
jgi:hypothetical protein